MSAFHKPPPPTPHASRKSSRNIYPAGMNENQLLIIDSAFMSSTFPVQTLATSNDLMNCLEFECNIGHGVNAAIKVASYRLINNNSTKVAIKAQPFNTKWTWARCRDFVKQLRVFSNNNNNNNISQCNRLAKVYAIWISNNVFYSMMPLFTKQAETKTVYDEQYLWNYMRSVAEILIPLHQLNTIHFDVKPDNIIALNNYEFALIDLGSITNLTPSIRKNMQLEADDNDIEGGDGNFIAPEVIQARCIQDLTTAVDIYSLGQTIYHLIKKHKISISKSFFKLILDTLMNMSSLRPTAHQIVEICNNNINTTLSNNNNYDNPEIINDNSSSPSTPKKRKIEDANFSTPNKS
jgi:serine/threonine protein kinase